MNAWVCEWQSEIKQVAEIIIPASCLTPIILSLYSVHFALLITPVIYSLAKYKSYEKNLHQCLSNKQLNISKFNAVIHASNNYMKFRACITKKEDKSF